jgi:hypothetical protein
MKEDHIQSSLGEKPMSVVPRFGLAKELLALQAADEAIRAELALEGSLFQGYHPRMESIHRQNAARLREIIAEYGWPGQSLVGEEAAYAAWVIVQHSIGEPDFQRHCLHLLQGAATKGDVPPLQVAMLEDRIRVLEGQPQRYGTQFDWDEQGQLSPYAIEEPDTVDERRRALGLCPLAEDIQRRREHIATTNEKPPTDWAARKKEEEAWLRQVGWRK